MPPNLQMLSTVITSQVLVLRPQFRSNLSLSHWQPKCDSALVSAVTSPQQHIEMLECIMGEGRHLGWSSFLNSQCCTGEGIISMHCNS